MEHDDYCSVSSATFAEEITKKYIPIKYLSIVIKNRQGRKESLNIFFKIKKSMT